MGWKVTEKNGFVSAARFSQDLKQTLRILFCNVSEIDNLYLKKIPDVMLKVYSS